MTTKHALKYNGAPYAENGELVHGDDTGITRGAGYAKCTCGALSASSLTNGTARRAWFKAHKADVQAVPVQDEIPLDPEPVAEPVAEPIAEPVAEAPEPVAEVPAEPETDEAAEPAFSTVLPFTKQSPASFWRYLGRDAVRELADRGALGLKVTVATNASNHTILISGPTEGQVDIARARIEQYWDEALESVKEWKKTDPTFLARPREGLEGRKAAFELTGEYYMSQVERYIRELV